MYEIAQYVIFNKPEYEVHNVVIIWSVWRESSARLSVSEPRGGKKRVRKWLWRWYCFDIVIRTSTHVYRKRHHRIVCILIVLPSWSCNLGLPWTGPKAHCHIFRQTECCHDIRQIKIELINWWRGLSKTWRNFANWLYTEGKSSV